MNKAKKYILYILLSASSIAVLTFLWLQVTGLISIQDILNRNDMAKDRLSFDYSKADQAKENEAISKNNNSSIVTISSEQAKLAFAQANNIDITSIQNIHGTNNYKVPVAKENVQLPAEFAGDYAVSNNVTYKALATPNDPLYQYQWHLSKISAPTAWDLSTGNPAVKVAVVDTGFAMNHQDLSSKFDTANAYDFVNNDTSPMAGTTNPNGQYLSHGTLTSGLVGASTNNGLGVSSIGWNLTVLPLQALDDDGFGDTASIISAINWAVSKGAKVISLSLGSDTQDALLEQAISSAVSSNVVVVAASGNDGCDCMLYPANYPSVISVGASNSSDNKSSFSSYGDNLDVVAPGEGTIRTTYINSGNYTSLYTTSASGTSISTPIVSGLAGLIKSIKSDMSPTEVETMIRSSTDKVSGMGGQDFTKQYGYGRVNAQKTLSLVRDYRWEYVGQSGPSSLAVTQKATWTVSAKNTGTTTWYNGGSNPVLLGTSRGMDRSSLFCTSSWYGCNRAALLNESSVPPGGIGTFTFEVQAPTNPGTYNEHFNLLSEGITWMNDPGLFFSTRVEGNSFSYQVVSSNFPSSIDANGTSNVSIVLKNTGNTYWYQDGKYPIRIGTYNPTDRLSKFQDVSWFATTRPAQMTESVVAPGQNATFNFTIKAPSVSGTYQEDYSLLAEGYRWFDIPISYSTSVTGGVSPPENPSEIINSMSSGQVLEPGESLVSGDGRYRLIMQGDGNLVLYSPSRALWHTSTQGRSPGFFVLQGDGNLVIYGADGRPYWASWTQGRGGNSLYMQGDGNLVLYTSGGQPVWHTSTHGQF